MNSGISPFGIGAIVVVFLVAVLGSCSVETVAAGHTAVGTYFGAVQDQTLEEGFHIVNPLMDWHHYDTRQKEFTQQEVGIPSQDQLTTNVDVTVKYRVDGAMVSTVLQETGTAEEAVTIHLVPFLRSVLREYGKTVPRAEDFFTEAVQTRLQSSLTDRMQENLAAKGIEVQEVLIRNIQLPQVLRRAIDQKKQREQEVERERAELERVRLEQQQAVARAEAQRDAAELEAERQRTLADARAYEIRALNEAAADNPVYVQLQALETLREMSTNPATQFYFLDGESEMPLPLLHMGDAANQHRTPVGAPAD